MKKVVITGANGMIGSLILELCLQDKQIESVLTLARKPLEIKHPKLRQQLHQDFLNFESIASIVSDYELCFFCLGVYTGAVSKEMFNTITIDYTKAFCKVFTHNNKHAEICFLSGQGADSSEKSNILFAKAKGIAENHLLKLPFKNVYIFRPGYIYPNEPRKEPNFAYRIFRFLYPLMKTIYPSGVIESRQLAEVMFKIGMQGGNKIIYENIDIRKIAKK